MTKKKKLADYQLSVCIIVKNESQNIGKCLDALTETGFEIIVADTGSTDDTREIARRYTQKVYDFPWCDDFSAARNFAISKASNPFVMMIDSDEFLESIDLEKLQQDFMQHPHRVGRIFRKNVFERNGIRHENTEWINRIFPKDSFRYEGCIHEQIVSKEESTYQTYQAPVVISHTGYNLPKEERRKKAERNKTLLIRELDRLYRQFYESNHGGNPDEKLQHNEQIPYILYQLGKSCYMAGDYADACDYFSRALSFDLNPKLEYVIDMVETYGYALLNSGQNEEALLFENIYDEFGNSADFQFLMGLIYMNNEQYDQAVREFLKATEHKHCRNSGTNSYAAYYNIGVIYECTGRNEEARKYFKMCGDYQPAQEQLKMIGNQ